MKREVLTSGNNRISKASLNAYHWHALEKIGEIVNKNAVFFVAAFFAISACFAQMQTSSSDAQQNQAVHHQIGIGLKAGINFANVTSASSINNTSRTGFMAGIFLAPPSHHILGFRTEILFSRQGYDYNSSSNTGSVNLDYIMLPQLMTINITKFVQLQVGGQMAFLINAKADSSNSSSSANNPYGKILDYYNRFDYGATGGIEIHPFLGLLIGARYNISFANVYKTSLNNTGTQQPSYFPNVNVRNNLVQLFAGYRF